MKKVLKKFIKIINLFVIIASVILCFTSCNKKNVETVNVEPTNSSRSKLEQTSDNNLSIDENASYTSKEEVALYIYTYKRLPKNFITKKEAEKLGWDKNKNNLHEVAGGKSIGGDRFFNYEKLLPDVKGRIYYECDIDYRGGARNSKRIVYADDFDENYGCIFYTSDHYKTFEKIY